MITIDYEDIYYEDLPIDAQQTVTGIDLVIAGETAGKDPDWVIDIGSSRYIYFFNMFPYVPLPVVYRHRDVDHGQYNFIRSEKLADYFNPFLHPLNSIQDGTLEFDWKDPSSNDPIIIYDGDDSTYIENTTAWNENNWQDHGLYIDYLYPDTSHIAGRVVGWRIVYSADFMSPDNKYYGNLHPRYIGMTHRQRLPGPLPGYPGHTNNWIQGVHAGWDLEDTGGEIRDIYAVFPPAIKMAQENEPGGDIDWRIWSTNIYLNIIGDEFPSPGSFKLYQFYPLVVDEESLHAVAQASVVKPAVRPGRIFVKGYVAPDDAVTINGFPGGNIVAVTKGFEYTHTKEQGLMTMISLEQDSILSEHDYGQRRRAIDEMVNKKIANDTYSVMMGSRK